MFIKTLLLTILLNTSNVNFVGPPLPEIEPLQELIEKRAFILQTKLEPLDSSQIALNVSNLAIEYNLSPLLLLAIIEKESRYDKKGESNKKCLGLLQVSKRIGKVTAKDLGMVKYNLYDIFDNLKIGTYFFSTILKQYPLLKALTIYNKGRGNWKKHPKISGYAKNIIKRFRYLKKIYDKTNLVCTAK